MMRSFNDHNDAVLRNRRVKLRIMMRSFNDHNDHVLRREREILRI
jgi:hypothetical protein